MLFDPFGDLGEMLVLLSNIIPLAEVDEVNDGFGTEEEEGIYDFYLIDPSNQSCPSEKLSSSEYV